MTPPPPHDVEIKKLNNSGLSQILPLKTSRGGKFLAEGEFFRCLTNNLRKKL
jgi:hypothetical protein